MWPVAKAIHIVHNHYHSTVHARTPHSTCAHHIPRHHSPHAHTTVRPLSLACRRIWSTWVTIWRMDLEDRRRRRAHDLQRRRAHDLQRRRAHDLQRLGHTICRGGGHMFLHQRREHGRRKWYDLFLLSLDFLTSFPWFQCHLNTTFLVSLGTFRKIWKRIEVK